MHDRVELMQDQAKSGPRERRHRLEAWAPVAPARQKAGAISGILAFWVLVVLFVCVAVVVSLHLRKSHPVADAPPAIKQQS